MNLILCTASSLSLASLIHDTISEPFQGFGRGGQVRAKTAA